MKTRLLSALVAFCALSLVALAGSSCRSHSRAADDKSKIHVGIVFDIGGKDDRSFNASAWEGVKRAEEELRKKGTPIVLRDVEPGDPTSIEPAMRAFAERGYDLIIGVGFAQTQIMQRVAKDYPELEFAIIDGEVPPNEQLPNVAYLLFEEHQGSYLVGMIAAKKSQTGRIGFIGGMEIDLIKKFAAGYIAGASAVNPKIDVIINYVGVTDVAWNNPGKGKELALAQIGKGADVIFTAAGNSGLGAFDAAEQNGKFVIGVDKNQNYVKPGYVLTSMEKRIDNAVESVVKDRAEGKFQGGVRRYGLMDGGVGYALDQYNKNLIPPEVILEVEAAKKKISAGEILVPDKLSQ